MFNIQSETTFVQYILISRCIQSALLYTHFELLHTLCFGHFSLLFHSHLSLCLFLWEGSHSILGFKILWPLQLHLFESNYLPKASITVLGVCFFFFLRVGEQSLQALGLPHQVLLFLFGDPPGLTLWRLESSGKILNLPSLIFWAKAEVILLLHVNKFGHAAYIHFQLQFFPWLLRDFTSNS